MPDLKRLFEDLGYTDVETFIASGNVIFVSGGESRMLEAEIARHLEKALGYAVPTFIRAPAELAAIVESNPFSADAGGEGKGTVSVIFLAEEGTAEMQAKLASYETSIDQLRLKGREIFWLTAGRTTDSLIDWPKLGKELRMPLNTVRNITTVQRLAEKFPVG